MVKTRIYCCPVHPNCEYISQSQLNRHLLTHDRPPRFKKPRNVDRHKQGACPFCPYIGGKHLARHMQQEHGQTKGKTMTPSFAQLAQWETIKAVKKARKEDQMQQTTTMASTLPPDEEDFDNTTTMEHNPGDEADRMEEKKDEIQQGAGFECR